VLDQVVTLEQNYRSTASVLTVANAIMSATKVAVGERTLWTADTREVRHRSITHRRPELSLIPLL
jgi:superfamily I DNA/RNA helicase